MNTNKTMSIAMWDTSWLERRWPGAGFEDWDLAFRQLKERGYDCIKISPYAHLIADGGDSYRLSPGYPGLLWGNIGCLDINIRRDLITFLEKCKEYDVYVALEGLYRVESKNLCMDIHSPEDQANVWIKTLSFIKENGYGDRIVYVDLCNEFPIPMFAPFYNREGNPDKEKWYSGISLDWMKRCVEAVRKEHGDMNYCFSFSEDYADNQDVDLSFFDLLSFNLNMVSSTDFGRLLSEKSNEGDDPFQVAADYAKPLYEADKELWLDSMRSNIDILANIADNNNLPLVTSEGWSIIHHKDFPGMEWDWTQEICEACVRYASSTGRWAILSPTIFAAPQFVGLWRDKNWHVMMNDIIQKSTSD